MRDSAGITIVENPSQDIADTTAWAIDTANAVSIGELDGDDMYVFGQIVGVTRQSNGRIVVADAQAHQVRFFDDKGRFLQAVGRAGGGPGEYINFHYLLRHIADSLIVIDYEGGRINVLDPEGKWIRSFRLDVKDGETRAEYTSPTEWAVFEDGSLLITDFLNNCRAHKEGELCTDSARFSRVTQDGQPLTRYGNSTYSREFFLETRSGYGMSLSYRYPQAHWGVNGSQLFHGDASSFEVKRFSASGKLDRIIRVDYPALPFPPEKPLRIDSSANPEQRKRREEYAAVLANTPMPESAPAFNGLLTDRAGHLWVSLHPAALPPSGISRWLVFDSTGTLRHSVRIPLSLYRGHPVYRWQGEIGADYVLGVDLDEGFERVRLYPLVKKESGTD